VSTFGTEFVSVCRQLCVLYLACNWTACLVVFW